LATLELCVSWERLCVFRFVAALTTDGSSYLPEIDLEKQPLPANVSLTIHALTLMSERWCQGFEVRNLREAKATSF
jgi:hypothetical protein